MSNRNLNPADGPTDCEPTTGRQVRLAEHLSSRIEQRLPGTEFDSVEEYVTFVMESVLRDLDELPDDERRNEVDDDAADVDSSDEAAMQERLESLGYL